MEKFLIIAIDGGAASGKSSTSRKLAEALELMHVDTGSHYRAVTHACLSAGVTSEGAETFLESAPLDTQIQGRRARIAIAGEVPAEEAIRSPEVNAAVSTFAANPAVRKFLFDYQRSQVTVAREAGFAGLVMEGRDIGSVILPDAPHRFFLEADEATRMQRRAAEGQTDAIAKRDQQDLSRKNAPLLCPEGATRIDTSKLTLDEVVATILAAVTGG